MLQYPMVRKDLGFLRDIEGVGVGEDEKQNP
jgi:hypothetical protein